MVKYIAVLKVYIEMKISKSCQIKSDYINMLTDCEHLGYQSISNKQQVLVNVNKFQTGYKD